LIFLILTATVAVIYSEALLLQPDGKLILLNVPHRKFRHILLNFSFDFDGVIIRERYQLV
jgi:hypothetical protein